MKPKFEMRIEKVVQVTMHKPKVIKAINGIKFPEAWESSYDAGTNEAVCHKWAATCGASIDQIHVENDKIKFYFRFPSVEAARDFIKDFEVNCCK
ncbi:MAG: hypothetical protein IJH12_00125 [Clostridia bacterium]|nr:hypothetical protein [Clostridia bacterium]